MNLLKKLTLHDALDIVGPLNRILTTTFNAYQLPLLQTDESDAEMALKMLKKQSAIEIPFSVKLKKVPFQAEKKHCP